ncbi:MAG TPA: pyridoxamine 5'-phosphate oxidase family protein [Candidatus Acidoferrales bacterium]|nr:pyridoxamine 5'-phosphate oxidase family protein [Candidatus Acidoferrales bacterium]
MNESAFWEKVHKTASKATWAYLATANGAQPKVRVVHPAFEGERLWIATGRNSAKARHIEKNPNVELFYQVGPEMIHVTVTGTAKFVEDAAEKKRIWNGKVFDYNLAEFWPDGPGSKEFGLMLVTPSRVELTSLPEMTTGVKPQVWRPSKK